MSQIYLQYHNCEQQGSLPHALSRDSERLQIYTRVASARRASGRVLIITGVGKPRRYFLWSTFSIDRFEQKPDGMIVLEGPGWQLAAPQELTGAEFQQFKAACANFIGFRQITELPFTKKLVQLADAHKPARKPAARRGFTKLIQEQSLGNPEEPTVALSIRQPHVEAIFRGIKNIEYRREATRRRGRILIYAAKLYADNLPYWVKKYGFEELNLEKLPRGVVVGSVDLHDCDGGEWHLRNPIRAKTLRRPTGRPQPIWFTPFE